MVNCVEIGFDVCVVNGAESLSKVGANLCQSIMSGTTRTKTVRAILKIRFENRFQDQKTRRLNHTVFHRGYSKRSLTPTGFGYPHPANRTGPVRLFLQLQPHTLKKRGQTSRLKTRGLRSSHRPTRQSLRSRERGGKLPPERTAERCGHITRRTGNPVLSRLSDPASISAKRVSSAFPFREQTLGP